MTRQEGTKLQYLMSSFPKGLVLTTKLLAANGFSMQLLSQYKNSHWLDSLGEGAYQRRGENVDWKGALAAMQEQLGLPVHCGGRTALVLQGYGHFTEFGSHPVYLFGSPGLKLPRWFEKHDWGVPIVYKMTKLCPVEISESFVDFPVGEYSIRVSSPERAAMEMLYHVPARQGFNEAERIMESLLTLQPPLVQKLLEACTSVKVKRLFLYMAESGHLPCLEEIDVSRINLGKGDRTVIKGGRLDPKYRITVPHKEAG
ncbi:MAG: type IV toxin-antitoxin system AbiEi family antitoxin [Syntrophorhabdaceae bacterium]|nr:type IV toxin-antitoxin system AbiEi family antitoxin [Syntrophorhabdaceae bacterium]